MLDTPYVEELSQLLMTIYNKAYRAEYDAALNGGRRSSRAVTPASKVFAAISYSVAGIFGSFAAVEAFTSILLNTPSITDTIYGVAKTWNMLKDSAVAVYDIAYTMMRFATVPPCTVFGQTGSSDGGWTYAVSQVCVYSIMCGMCMCMYTYTYTSLCSINTIHIHMCRRPTTPS